MLLALIALGVVAVLAVAAKITADAHAAVGRELAVIRAELELGRRRDLEGAAVVVHTTDGQSVKGVVVAELEDGTLDLRSAVYLQADGSGVELEGVARIAGSSRSWLQIER